jgi:small-conductance mechanosensitive channel
VSDRARPPRATPARRSPKLAAPRVLAVPAGAALVLVGLFAVPRTLLLLAGALVAALLIIAGRQILADLIAGVVLRRARTVRLGDRVRLYPGRMQMPSTRTSAASSVSSRSRASWWARARGSLAASTHTRRE